MKSMSETIERVKLPDGFEMPVIAWADGDSDARSVVCLHSLFFSGEMFKPVASKLAFGRHCFAPTYRGHAGQPTAGTMPSIEQLAQDIIDWMNLTGLAQVHLIGSSMGAYVAMEMMRDHSDRIASVVLSCCTCEKEANPERFSDLAKFISSGPKDTTGQVVSNVMFGAASIAEPSPVVQAWIDSFELTPPTMAFALNAMFAHPDYSTVLDAYTGPALLLAGAQDRAKSIADMHHIATHVPQAETFIFADTGHTPAVEAPEIFANRFLDFITQVEFSALQSQPSYFPT